MRTLLPVGGGILGTVAVLGLAFLVSFRTRFRPVLDGIRRMNRRVMNPRQLRTAGRPGAYASVVHHVGRRSGTPYRTPVVAVPADDGFVVALPYGAGADWVRNVLAAGRARIEHEGRTFAVGPPEVVPAATTAASFPPGERRTQRLFGIDEVLRLPTTSAP